MARGISRAPFGYRPGSTPLHRAPAGLKLAALFALSAAAFSSIPGLLLSALFVAGAGLLARVKPWELLRGCRPLLVLSLVMIAFAAIRPGEPGPVLDGMTVFGLDIPPLALPGLSPGGFFTGVLSGLRVLVSFAAGSLLFAVSTMRELRLSLGRAERALVNCVARPKNAAALPHGRVSLGLSLMLGFIPRFFELWETVNLACEARSCRRGIRRLAISLPLVCERMMEMAADTAEALEARGISL
jgi:biotin transport system permease protein